MQNKINNKIKPVFKTNLLPGKPYYFIDACLNISEILPLKANTPFEILLYFNKENNFNYLSYPEIDSYPHYWTLTKENGVIEDILIYSFPSINQINTLENIYLNSIRVGMSVPPSTTNGASYPFEDQLTGLTGIDATNIQNSLSNVQLDFISQKRSLGRCIKQIDPNNKYLCLYLQGFTGPINLSSRNSIFIHFLLKIYQKNT